MVILSKTYGESKNRAKISLDEFVKLAQLKKSHVSRSLSLLEERSVITISLYRGKLKDSSKSVPNYAIQKKPEKWRSYIYIKMPDDVKKKHEEAFKEWIDLYPLKVQEQETRVIYLNIISDGETPERLWDGLVGYLKFEARRCEKLNKEPDPWGLMYPTNFLKSGKWEGYIRFKDLKREPRL